MSSIGAKCVFACDIDAECRKTYELNYGIKPGSDITKIKAEEIKSGKGKGKSRYVLDTDMD